MNTKSDIITAAVQLISSRPESAQAGYDFVPFKTSAETDYEFILGQELECFMYNFSLQKVTLENPEFIPDKDGEPRQDLVKYSAPSDISYPLAVVKESDIPDARLFLGKRGTKNTPSLYYSLQDENKIFVQTYPEADENLVLLYVSNDPPVQRMSSSFKNGLRYGIAANIALTKVQQKSVAQQFSAISKTSFEKARKLSLYGANTKYYFNTPVSRSIYSATTDGDTPNSLVPESLGVYDRYRRT